MTSQRCGWCSEDPTYIDYHDNEWGKANFNEQHLFEMLCLEGQQAGLSWITVLKKRESYRQHFFHHSIEKIAQLSDEDLAEKCLDTGLIRHIGKLKAIRDNAQAWINMREQNIDMVKWLWDFVDQKVKYNDVERYQDAPAQTEISQQMSKTLKKNGFKFVGPTTCYAFMQAVGMVDDHENRCPHKTSKNLQQP